MNIRIWNQWVDREAKKGAVTVHSRHAVSNPDWLLRAAFDTRLLAEGVADPTLFIAIPGAWHDGHNFVEHAYAMGVRFFVVSNAYSAPSFPDADVIAAADVIQAWQDLAGLWRGQWKGQLLGITGSNGKTMVKEWLANLLNDHYAVHASPRSYNSQIGVPCSLWDLTDGQDLALIEAGISQPGEMKRHAVCMRPNFGILTHLGDAHRSAFEDDVALLEEKIVLFENCQWIVVPGYLHEAIHALRKRGLNVITWGEHESNDLHVSAAASTEGRTVHARWKGAAFDWFLPFAGEPAFRNAMTAALTALQLGVSSSVIAEQWQHLSDLDMRVQRFRASDGSWVLSDVYTNDWDALELALQDLTRLPGEHPKAAIIGPVPGMTDRDLPRLKSLLSRHGLQKIWLAGEGWKGWNLDALNHPDCVRYPDTKSALMALQQRPDVLKGHDILLKGPRAERFERFQPLLLQRGHVTSLELDLEAVAHNLRVIRRYMRKHGGPQVELLSVVKASGYGTNGPALARLLAFHGVGLLAVACTEEGVELRQQGIRTRILVLNPDPITFPALLKHRLEPALHRLEHWDQFESARSASQPNKAWSVHVTLDTGMHRLGFPESDWTALRQRMVDHPHLNVRSVFSHLASADVSEQDAQTQGQIDLFEKAIKSLRHPSQPFKTHLLNTAGLIRFPQHAGDYVRVGIGLFGIRVTAVPEEWDLQPALRFTTSISTILDIPANDGIGYGLSDVQSHPRRIATLPVGYADGYPRHLSNGAGSVGLHGQLAPVVGKVCMDMIMIDVTQIPEAHVGDRVELFGVFPTIESVAEAAGTIPYELLTRIPSRVQREQRGN